MIAWDMSLMLEAAGFEVVGTAASGDVALEKALALRPNVVLMDVNLNNGMDGVETARALRARGADAAVIFVTGFGDPETARRIRAFGPSDYLLKPVEPETLEAAITGALERGSGSA
jgi:DNA-binding NarL/FixJ family response regulator